MMNKFEDRLIDELMAEHGPALAMLNRPEQARRSHRPVWMTAGALAVAAAVAVGFTLAGGGSGTAQAVTLNPNGTVTVTLKDLSQADEANAELARLGVPIRVVDMNKLHCPSGRLVQDKSDVAATPVMFRDNTITVPANAVPKGDTMALTAIKAHDYSNTSAVVLGIAVIKGGTPVCAQ